MRPQFQASALLVRITGLAEEHADVAELLLAVKVVAAAVAVVVAANTAARVVKIFDIF
jgi:hypothetical protein